MSPLFDGLRALQGRQLGTLIVVGAGSGELLESCGSMAWRRLVLVEGDADTLLELRSAAGARRDVEIVGHAAAPQAGTVSWHRYNLSSLNGPLRAERWVSAYPRLRPEATVTVAAVAIGDLLAAVAATPGEPNLLLMDVPGQEDALLAAVPGEVLRRFEWIVLRGSVGDAGDGWLPAAAARLRLEREGFAAVDTGLPPEPLWPVTPMHFDARIFAESRLHEQLAAAAARLRLLEDRVESDQSERQRLERAFADAEALAREQRELAQALALARDEQSRLAAERLAELQAAGAQAVARQAVHDEAVMKLQQELEALRKSRDTAQAELQAKNQALAQAAQERQQQLDELAKDRLAAERNTADRLRALESELLGARQSAALSVKLQMLREADLRDLQARYRDAVAQQQSQHELLTKLAQRLTVANDYFHQLSHAQPQGGVATRKVARKAQASLPAAAPKKRMTRQGPTEG